MWWAIWWISSDWKVIKLTQEELEKQCIHIFKDIEETDTYIKSKCIRCWKERIYNN